MSADAERYVRAHPGIRPSERALLDAIAQLIPDGHDTTSSISQDDLAAQARLHRRTVVKLISVLVKAGELDAIDGRQGRIARYRLAHLQGARPPTTAPLPLLGAAAPPRRPAPRARVTAPAPLFDTPPMAAADAQRANNVWRAITSWLVVRVIVDHMLPSNLWRSITSTLGNLWRSITSTRHVLAVDARARARSEEEIQEEDARAREAAEIDARAPDVRAFLEWFATEYTVSHQGARCTVAAADPFKIDELLRLGRSVERLKLLTRVMWTLTSDGVHGSERWYIAEGAPVRNIWLLHRKADVLDAELSRRTDQAGSRGAATPQLRPHSVGPERRWDDVVGEDVWSEILRHIQRKVNKYSFGTWWFDSVLVREQPGAIDVATNPDRARWIEKHYSQILADAVAEVRPGLRVHFVDVDDVEEKQHASGGGRS